MRDARGTAFEDTEGVRSVSPIIPKVEGKYEMITVHDDKASARATTQESAGGMEQILPHAGRSPPDRAVWQARR